MELLKQTLYDTYKNLVFDEEKHQYTYFKVKLTPVSNVVNKFCKPFDKNKSALFTARKTGKTPIEVITEWDNIGKAASELGTKVHLFAENWTKESIPTSIIEEGVCNYFNNYEETRGDLIPLLREFRMFSKQLLIAGTTDRVDFNTITGEYTIIDYKTNKDLYKNYKGQKLLYPFDDLLDCPFNKYQIQLSLYDILFQKTGNKVKDRKIVWFKHNGEYEVIECENYTDRLNNYFNK